MTLWLLSCWAIAHAANANPPPAPTPDKSATAPSWAVGAARPTLVWIEGTAPPRVVTARLEQDGWTRPETIAANPQIAPVGVDPPLLARSQDGSWVASWPESIPDHPHALHVVVARRAPGEPWQRLGRPYDDDSPTEHAFATLTPDAEGVRVSWLDGRSTATGGPTALRSAHITAGGISAEVVLDARTCDCCATASAGGAATSWVAWRDRSDTEVRDIAVARLDSQGQTAIPVPADQWEISGCPVNGPALAIVQGTPVVGWYTGQAERTGVQMAWLDASPAPISVSGPTATGRVTVVALPADQAAISWLESTADGVELRVRVVARDGRTGPTRTIARLPLAHRAGHPRLTRDGGLLRAAWAAPGGGIAVSALAWADLRPAAAPADAAP